MKKLIPFLFLLLLQLPAFAQPTIPAADFPLVTTMGPTNRFYIIVGSGAGASRLIELTNLINVIVSQPNFIAAAGVTNIFIEAGTNIVVDTNTLGASTIYKISTSSSATNGLATIEFVEAHATNSVWVRAGANITIATNVTPQGIIFTVTGLAGGGGTSTNAITTLNGLTALAQNFLIGSSGADATITSSGSNHTWNLPTTSSSARGLVTPTQHDTWHAKQPTNARLTDLASNPIPYTNVIVSGTNIVITTNGGIVTISTLGYATIFGVDLNNFTTNNGILAANTNFTITDTFFGRRIVLSDTGHGIVDFFDDSGTKRWSVFSTNLMSTNVELMLPGFAKTGIWYGSLVNNTNFALEFIGADTDGKVLTLTSGKPTWETPAAGADGGDTNAFYYVRVATNSLANEIVQEKLTNGSIQLPLTLALMSATPPELDPGSNSFPRLRFDGGSSIESCYWFFTLPDDYGSGGTVTYPFTTLSSSTTQTSMWFQFTMINNPGSATTVDVNNYQATASNAVVHPVTAGHPSSFSLSCNISGTAVAGDFIKIALVRDPTDAKDNAASDVALRPNPIFQYNRR